MARGYSISVRRGVESLRLRLAGAWYRSALYQWRLGGTRATQVLLVPHDPWPGDSEVGKAILRGAFNFRNDRSGAARNCRSSPTISPGFATCGRPGPTPAAGWAAN